MIPNQELANILAQTTATAPIDLPHENIQNAVDNIFSIKFNLQLFFVVLKSISETLAHYYKPAHNSSSDNNKELLKFTYLGQLHFTRLSMNANLFPENIKYFCFELALFYLALVKLANEFKFDNLAKSLLQLEQKIFQTNNTLAMIAITKISFEKWYLKERNLYEKIFGIYYISSHASNVTYSMDILLYDIYHASEILLELLKDLKSDTYQKQLALNLTKYLHLDSIFVECTTRTIVTDSLTAINDSHSAEEKRQIIEKFREEYQRCLFNKFKEKQLARLSELISVDLSCCDFSKINLDLSLFNSATFAKGVNQTKLPPHIACCIFYDISFTGQMMNNTSFKHCAFIKCTFNKLSLKTNLTDCSFDRCEFKDTLMEWCDLSRCKIQSCKFLRNSWYRVIAVDTEICTSVFYETTIQFSNLRGSNIETSILRYVSFEGTIIKLRLKGYSMFHCNLSNALYINAIDEAENERPAINNVIATHFSHADTNHILVNSEQIKTMIDQLARSNMPWVPENFKRLMSWILCGVDRITEYCHKFEKDPEHFSLFDKFTNLEQLATTVSKAMKSLNKFLTLTDRCHLTLMTRALLKNNLFNNFDQYQQLTKYNSALYPQDSKNYLREMLYTIHKLSQTIKYMEEGMSQIREKKDTIDRQHSRLGNRDQAR